VPFRIRISPKQLRRHAANFECGAFMTPFPSIRMLSASTMTAQRQEGNRRYRTSALFASFAGLLTAILVSAAPLACQAATTERVVANRFTGLAIEGFDPVAYFVDAGHSGAVWRFRNEGNRASFLAHPDVYGPRFGGYDPTDLARGVTLAGNPLFWVIFGQRLYLFGVEANRDAFATDPARFLPQADRHWPALERGLSQ
jgi:hypothetical protein